MYIIHVWLSYFVSDYKTGIIIPVWTKKWQSILLKSLVFPRPQQLNPKTIGLLALTPPNIFTLQSTPYVQRRSLNFGLRAGKLTLIKQNYD